MRVQKVTDVVSKTITNETVRIKFRNNLYIPVMRRKLRRSLEVTDFTIISNNCWAGTVYETYGLPKLTPTVGMFIMPSDYLKFVTSLDSYVTEPLEFISPKESKWRSVLEGLPIWKSYLIGKVGDVELHMQHYNDEDAARRKWNSRIHRINPDKLIFKFNDQNGATNQQLKKFDDLGLRNKLIFTVRHIPELHHGIRVPSPRNHNYIRASYEPIAKNRVFEFGPYVNTLFGAN